MSVTVYTTPNCIQCNATKKHLERRGIEFNVIDLTQNPDKLEMFLSQGLNAAPIVVTNNAIWSGYRPAEIDAIEK
jgi:glutaredoxin-like protein NrdH